MAITQQSFINREGSLKRQEVLNGLGFTPENVANKTTILVGESDVKYPTEKTVYDGLALKQDRLEYDTDLGMFILEDGEYDS